MTASSARESMSDPAAAKPWIASYPAGVPATIDADSLGTLVDMFRQAVSEYAQRPAAESFGKRMTYAELGRAADTIAAWLLSQGLKKGDRVAIMLPNVMAYPAVLYGILSAGCTVVNVNPLYTARELSHQLADAGARILFVLENFGHTVEEAQGNVKLDQVVVVAPGDFLGFKGAIVNFVSRKVKKAVKPFNLRNALPLSTVLAVGRGALKANVPVGPEDVAFLQYTGGTTGVAKGATLTHRNVAANVEQTRVWFEPALSKAGGPPVMVTALPLYHIFALTCCGLLMTRIGGCCLLIANPRDIPGFVKILKGSHFTMFCGLNTLFNALANHPDIGKVDFSHLRLCNSGGMATQAHVAKKWKELTGRPIVEGYGLSETSPVLTANPHDLDEFSGTIGFPLSSTEISIRDDQGNPVPQGEPGELCARGPQVMAGYWNRPDETAKVMTADGFFRTGDIAVMLPDGQFRIVDRMKDMVLVSGFNVYPTEVEEVIASCPGVLEAAVIGLPDDRSGEVVAAYVVKKDPAVTEEAVRAHCKANLTGYKVPRRIEFRDALPKTNVGKVLRRALREEVLGRKAG